MMLLLQRTLCTLSISSVRSKNSNCQALSISLSLNLSLSLRDRDRADTIITFHHTTPHHQHLFIGDLYSSVIHHWNRQLKPYSFPLRKNRVNKYYSDLYSSVIHHWNRQLKPYSFSFRKNR